MNKTTHKLHDLSKYIKGFLLTFSVSAFIVGFLIFTYGSYRNFDFVTLSWAFQHAVLIGLGAGIGQVMAYLPISTLIQKRLLRIAVFVAVGFLLFIALAFVYIRFFLT
jgi:hypothetical protein